MADKTQHLMWTALPNGYAEETEYRVSVLVSPELTRTDAVPPRLDQFPDMVDWPAVLAQTKFEIVFNGSVIQNPTRISAADSAVWTSVFPPDTFVRSHSFEDRRGTVVLSYPLDSVHDFVRDIYATLVAEAGPDLPDRNDHLKHLRPLLEDLSEPRDWLRRLRDPAFVPDRQDPRTAFGLLQAYHRPLATEETAVYRKNLNGPDEDPREDAQWRTHKLVDLPKKEDFKHLIDFHQIVSSTNQYYGLLRKLGLVIDFVLPADRMPDVAVTDRLRVNVSWPSGDPGATGVATLPDTLPHTITRLDPKVSFRPVPANPATPIRDGYLALAEQYRLLQMDVDGAGIKVKNFAASLHTMRGRAKHEPEPQVGSPALRTNGILLVEPRRASALTRAIDRSGKMADLEAGGGDVELFQEDVIRGYHADIQDMDKGDWQSLCRRDGLIDLVDTAADLPVEDEEGVLRLGVTSAADGAEPDVVKLYEGLFAWSGWSLSAPPPGRAIDTDDSVGDLSNSAPIGMTFQANFRPHKGSLPSLRFGHTYRMRVRVADLALNAHPWTPKDIQPPIAASRPLTYRRFEPVESPALALGMTAGAPEKPGDGEAMARIAIRSFNDAPADNAVPTAATARRHVVASRTSVKQAETHGMIDDATGRIDPASYAMLSTLDMPLTGVKLSFDGVDQDYPVAPDGFSLPYLPDPFAHAVAPRFMGPAALAVASLPDIPYYPNPPGDAWPGALPFQIRIVEDPGQAPAFDAGTRTLTVPLAKADIVRLRLSHVLPDKALDQMGLWHWFLDRFGGNAALVDAVRKLSLAGGNWTLTPWTEIELVHAVQKPLVQPEIQKLGIGRHLGATAAQLTFHTPADSHSTDKLDLFGRWNEPQDPLAEAGPRNLIRRGHAHERKLDYAEAAGVAPPGRVNFRSVAHEFGDTRYRLVRYRLEATTRFREFMPPAIRDPLVPGETNPQLKVLSDETVGWVPNSAPPPAPDILYVIPTFGWTRRKAGTERTSWRDGGGLRVYLNRPWFVSGHNEMLAVVLPPDNATRAQIDRQLKALVTQWGTDPIWAGTNIKTPAPGLPAFPLAQKAGPLAAATLPAFVPVEEAELPPGPFPLSGLVNPTLPATSPLRVNVAPHAVGYDSERQLWYCDIVIDPGRAYYPFVRLALARYHPVSTPGAHLSPIVTTEFLQLTPDRLATVTPGAGRQSFNVGLYGHSYTKGPGAPLHTPAGQTVPPVVEISVETLDETLGEDFGWSPLAGAVVKKARPARRTEAATAARGTSATTRAANLTVRANELLAARDFTAILADRDLVALLRPPTLWEGTVTLPDQRPRPGRLRLAIREYERHQIDSDHITVPPGAPDPHLRLVYAEFVDLA